MKFCEICNEKRLNSYDDTKDLFLYQNLLYISEIIHNSVIYYYYKAFLLNYLMIKKSQKQIGRKKYLFTFYKSK